MKVLLRVDSATHIGAGHMMRCLTLARQLRTQGADCIFVSRVFDGAINDKITAAGFALSELPPVTGAENTDSDDGPPHANWLGTTWQQDLAQTIALVDDARFNWLVVDHYGLDKDWHTAMRAYADRIAVIDELADRALDCDLLICQSPHAAKLEQAFDQCLPNTAQRLIGPQYALLRPDFAARRDAAVTRRANGAGEPTSVLVANGYVDAGGLVPLCLQALQQYPDLAVHVVIGTGSPSLPMARQLAKSMTQVTIHEDASNVPDLMVQADFAIGGGGVSSFERATLGLPALAASVADNQVDLVAQLDQLGVVRSLGSLEVLTVEKLAQAIDAYLADGAGRAAMIKASFDLCDGGGADHVCRAMLGR